MHGDLHFANALRSDREPWLAIDPKGYAGTAAFDAATIAEVDRDLAVRATQARMVSSAFWERLHGQPRMGIETADRIAADWFNGWLCRSRWWRPGGRVGPTWLR